MTIRRSIAGLAWLTAVATTPLTGQDSALSRGVAAMTAHDLPTARALLTVAARRDTASYEANWRLAITLVDLGKQTPDDRKSPSRDSLYAEAESYARRAVTANPEGADGHFALAVAIGRSSLTRSTRDRIRLATVIRDEALAALRIDPHHDGACHVMGRWNAEIMRLSGLEKFFAKAFLGAGIFNRASWEDAERYMALSVEYGPQRITHRLDYALVLMDRGRWLAARAQVDTLLRLPVADPMDPTYQQQGRALLPKLAEKLAK